MPVPKAWYVNGHVLCIFLSALSAILFSSWVTFVYWRQSLVYLHPETQLFLRFVTLICHAVSQGLAKHWCGWTRRCLVCCYLGFIAQNKPCNSLYRIAEVCIPSLSVTGARKKKNAVRGRRPNHTAIVSHWFAMHFHATLASENFDFHPLSGCYRLLIFSCSGLQADCSTSQLILAVKASSVSS